MSLFTIDVARSPLGRINPVAKLAATLVVSVTLLLSIDPVSAGVSLAATLVLLPFARLPWRQVWLRVWPIALAAVIASLATVLYGRVSGEVFWQWGLVRISEGSIDLSLAILLRVLAIAVPSVLLFATTDPTDLADGLAQVLRLPASPPSTKLATAMEARGFGAPGARTWARPSLLRPRDGVLVLIAAVGTLAIGAVSFMTLGREFIPTLDEGDIAMQALRVKDFGVSLQFGNYR